MFLDNFEDGFKTHILKRAESYCAEGKIQSLEKTDEVLTANGHTEEWIAIVCGGINYRVTFRSTKRTYSKNSKFNEYLEKIANKYDEYN